MGNKQLPIAYGLTMPTFENKAHFALPEHATMIGQVVKDLRGKGLFKLYALAVLPDRLEILLKPAGGDNLKAVLYELRLRTGTACRDRKVAQNVWAPRSEITKYFDPETVAARIQEIHDLPAVLSSARPDAATDAVMSAPESEAPDEPTVVPIKQAVAAA